MRAIDRLRMKVKGMTDTAIEAENAKRLEYDKYMSNKARLEELSKDIVQYVVGEDVPDYNEKRGEFIRLHNEVRAYEGKQPRAIRG
ncbi:MAG: hypothetical protein HFK07_01075 [Clostridia bacterium]|nr:hypothetical protein [Clostridia bacterium]